MKCFKKIYCSSLRLLLLFFCLLFILTSTVSCTFPSDVSQIRESLQLIEADTEAIADEGVKNPDVMAKRKKKRNGIPPPNDKTDWMNILYLIIPLFLGISATKHSGQMISGLGKMFFKGKK